MRTSVLLLLYLFFTASCSTSDSQVLDESELFQLSFGRMEEHFNYALGSNSLYQFRNHIVMQNGLIYLVNGQSYKMMIFTSFGDLIRMFYHPSENPQPLLLAPYEAGGQITTRLAIAYEFGNISNIAVTEDGVQFIVNQLHPDRAVFDEDAGLYLSHTIIRFSAEGEFLDYLGQEGIGGTPFPYIESLWLTKGQELVIVCKTTDAWMAYLFSRDGELRYHVVFPLDRLPIPEEPGVIPILEYIIPSNLHPTLYVKLHYLQELFDEETSARSAINYYGSRIYTLDLVQSQYVDYVDLTFDAAEKGDYEFIGLSQRDDFFLLRNSEESEESLDLIIVDLRGNILRKRSLVTGNIFDRILHVNSDDSIVALLIRNEHVDVVRWSSDALWGES